jgi:type I restriction enzyme, S subunit
VKWALEGKLTNENVLDGELPKAWKKTMLGKVCNKIQDGSHFSPQVQYEEPAENRFMYITAKNIRNNYMDFRKLIYVDRDFHESIFTRCNPEFGDVLLTKDGINTGEVTLNTLHEPFSLLSSVCIFKTRKEDLKSEFLKYFIQSPLGLKAILNSMTGTAIKRIVLRKIKDSEIILPPIKEQILIVKEIESRLSVCDKIEEIIENGLLQAQALRLSIIKKGFEGKLVKQNPSDEPAQKLLERIRAEIKRYTPDKPAKKAKIKFKKKEPI